MSYEQAMKHSKNHRKNRFYQQCSGYAGDGVGHQKTDEEIHNMETSSFQKVLEKAKHLVFPIYIASTGEGYYFICDEKNLFGEKIDSYEELIQFGKDYVGYEEPWVQNKKPSLSERIADAREKSALIGNGDRTSNKDDIQK